MSKKGRRIRTAEENKKKAFRKMIEFLIMGALMLCFLAVEASYRFPEYAKLEQYEGFYQKLESRHSGRRKSYASGLILEDGSSFYIHKDFDRDSFEANVKPGDKLAILADPDYKSVYIRTDEPVVYELRTGTGEKLRDYEATLAYLRKDKRFKVSILGAVFLIDIAAVFDSFRSWRKYSRWIQEYSERKKA